MCYKILKYKILKIKTISFFLFYQVNFLLNYQMNSCTFLNLFHYSNNVEHDLKLRENRLCIFGIYDHTILKAFSSILELFTKET